MMSDVPVVSLRLANVTGPRLAIGPIPTFYKRLKAGQKCFCSDTVRDFLDMSDFLAIADLSLQEGRPTGVFNVSTGEGHSIKEVFDVVLDYVGATLAEPVPVVAPGADDGPAWSWIPRRPRRNSAGRPRSISRTRLPGNWPGTTNMV